MQDNKLVIGLMLVATVVVGAILLISLGSNNTEETTTDTQQESNDSVSVAEALSENNLSTLETTLEAAGLLSTVAGSENNLTVFAPTNQAFSEIQETVNSLLLPENKEKLVEVLTSHVVENKVLSSQLSDGMTVPTLSGAELKVRITDDEVYINDSKVTKADVVAGNITIHIIDKVIVSDNFGNIVETAQGTADLSTLVTAVVAAELVGNLADSNASLTVFAPVNSAFAKIQDTVNTLVTSADKQPLQYVLLTHVVGSEVFAGELRNGQEITTLSGVKLSVEISNDQVFLVGPKNRVEVIATNVLTTNGIVHLINDVILP
ncbi:MAG: fasciclin domain-containing protein [Candidatus Dojkabacteria bacterium]|nr:MAG: fasciclin domain-containing protein [Candidatus Dojkabacteria bacterium]